MGVKYIIPLNSGFLLLVYKSLTIEGVGDCGANGRQTATYPTGALFRA